jgi:hypothetical protein
MSDTTTIQVTKQQREDLREINSGSAKAAVAVLLEAYENDHGGESVDAERVAELVTDDLRASLPRDVADEVEGRLR